MCHAIWIDEIVIYAIFRYDKRIKAKSRGSSHWWNYWDTVDENFHESKLVISDANPDNKEELRKKHAAAPQQIVKMIFKMADDV